MVQATKNTIYIKNAPQIEGLSFRSYTGLEDCVAMTEIINASNQTDKIDAFYTVEGVENNYKQLQRTDPARDIVFIEIDGEPVGFGRCRWSKELTGNYTYDFHFYVKPEGRLPGLIESVIDYFIDRLYEISEDHPADAPKFYQAWASNHQPWYMEMIEDLDFEPIRYEFEMSRPCSEPMEVTSLPDGIEVRRPTPEQYRQVWEAQAEAFRDHWGYTEPTETNFQWWLNFPFFDPERDLWRVAWEGEEVVGMVLNFIDHEENKQAGRKRGYTEFISVRRPWRRMGVARALLTQSIKMFQELGMDETSLGVDTKNPNGALHLYESVGYRERERTTLYRKKI